MKNTDFRISTCRNCRYFTPEGRRGGYCQQLSVLVHAHWKTCPLAVAAFAPSWELLEQLVRLPSEERSVSSAMELEDADEAAAPTASPAMNADALASTGDRSIRANPKPRSSPAPTRTLNVV